MSLQQQLDTFIQQWDSSFKHPAEILLNSNSEYSIKVKDIKQNSTGWDVCVRITDMKFFNFNLEV